MKKLLLILLFCPIIGLGQKNFNQVINQQNLTTKSDSLQFQISYTNYCLNQYRKEKITGTWIQLISAVTVLAFNMDNINGVDKTTRIYELETEAAGSNVFNQLAALSKFEKKIIKIEDRNDILTIAGGVVFLAGSFLNL
jgi:hypothetical protein